MVTTTRLQQVVAHLLAVYPRVRATRVRPCNCVARAGITVRGGSAHTELVRACAPRRASASLGLSAPAHPPASRRTTGQSQADPAALSGGGAAPPAAPLATVPVAPPGTYSARLCVNDGEPQVHSFRVRKDPRSTATDADLLAQFNLLIAIRDKTSEANNAVHLVRNMRWNVGDRTGKLTAQQQAEFKAIADGMMGALTKAEQEAYQTKNESHQDPLNFPIRLNNEIAGVASYVSQGEYRPTKQAFEDFGVLSKELDAQTKAIKAAMDKDLPRLNAILRAAGL